MTPKARAAELLAWYDRHRRALPWRARAGERPDPYRVWASEIMLQQTTVGAVKPYYERFMARFPTVKALAEAPSEAVMQAWAGLGYYSRARNLHACARVVMAEHRGRFPDTEEALRALPGIGAYTAGAVAAIAFDRPAAAVDGNVERVMTRLFAIEDELPGARPLVRERVLGLMPQDRPGDFAQALMDLGATICTPRNPACGLCPWREPCRARKAGTQESFPRKAPKKAGATRYGAAFVLARADGALLLRTRPAKGLLGGMAEVPTSEWRADYALDGAAQDAPLPLRWQRLAQPVRHVFTHFPLELSVLVGQAPVATQAPRGMRFTPMAELGEEPLPSLMRKVVEAGLAALRPPPSAP
ncbi:A/G-specific adenine glycosylase [Bosea sp. (in: a-proteobacteria)]|uniref:A/G-specific adenine glycosylase n=1 Tax=Bosea sp. (in: a-proteobacteria) TaxID=1871050 RepID=UPI0026292912|nr:A/G-specific adenine glycosylase [Bosea sp. (in: a-proteobacteria)]MCO5092359.1 A/G-specific adenine glycosylase [Bosea sp. (in: a-proteobacteria)]